MLQFTFAFSLHMIKARSNAIANQNEVNCLEYSGTHCYTSIDTFDKYQARSSSTKDRAFLPYLRVAK